MDRIRRDERGAEAVEFAVAAPVVLLLVVGIVYALLTLAAQVSLAYAASAGARHAAIPVDPVLGAYPSPDDVAAKVDASTPFFGADACASSVDGGTGQNDVVVLEVDCAMPNPVGRVLGALLGSDAFGDTVTISARAAARRE